MLASRLPLATGWGFFLSLATFWLLWLTINTPLSIGERVVARPIQFTPTIRDSQPVENPPRKKPEFVPPQTIGPPDVITISADPPMTTHPGDRPRIEFPTPPGPVTSQGGSDHGAIPVVRIPPEYPPAAQRRGIEGWVLVQFSVTASGQVTDVFVVDADPPGVFDEKTIDALRRWRYQPKVEDGRPVESVGLQAVIRFDMP